MRIAVLSDIHANYHALEAVLAAVDAEASTRSGVSVTRSATGRARTAAARSCAERAAFCLAGNHDLAVIGALSVDEFNGDAAAAVRVDTGRARDDARAFLEGARAGRGRVPGRRALPRQPDRPGLGLRAERGCGLLELQATGAARPRRPQPRLRSRSRWDGSDARRRSRQAESRSTYRVALAAQPRLGRANRGAATRAQRLALVDDRRVGQRSVVSRMRSSGRRRRSASAACRRRSPSGSPTASEKEAPLAQLTNLEVQAAARSSGWRWPPRTLPRR